MKRHPCQLLSEMKTGPYSRIKEEGSGVKRLVYSQGTERTSDEMSWTSTRIFSFRSSNERKEFLLTTYRRSRGKTSGIESLALACLPVLISCKNKKKLKKRNKLLTRMLSQRCWKGNLYSGSTLPLLTRKNHPQKKSIPDGWAQAKHPESVEQRIAEQESMKSVKLPFSSLLQDLSRMKQRRSCECRIAATDFRS